MNLCPGTKRRYFLRMTRPSIVWLLEKLLCKHANSVRIHRGCQHGAGYGPVLACTQRLVCIQSAAHLRTNMVKGRIELHLFPVSLRFQLAHNIKCWRKCSCVSSITQSLIEDLKEKKMPHPDICSLCHLFKIIFFNMQLVGVRTHICNSKRKQLMLLDQIYWIGK